MTYFPEATYGTIKWLDHKTTSMNSSLFLFFFGGGGIKQVAGLIEAKGGFSLMVIMHTGTCLAKVRVQGQRYTLVLYMLWYQNPMHMGEGLMVFRTLILGR